MPMYSCHFFFVPILHPTWTSFPYLPKTRYSSINPNTASGPILWHGLGQNAYIKIFPSLNSHSTMSGHPSGTQPVHILSSTTFPYHILIPNQMFNPSRTISTCPLLVFLLYLRRTIPTTQCLMRTPNSIWQKPNSLPSSSKHCLVSCMPFSESCIYIFNKHLFSWQRFLLCMGQALEIRQ